MRSRPLATVSLPHHLTGEKAQEGSPSPRDGGEHPQCRGCPPVWPGASAGPCSVACSNGEGGSSSWSPRGSCLLALISSGGSQLVGAEWQLQPFQGLSVKRPAGTAGLPASPDRPQALPRQAPPPPPAQRAPTRPPPRIPLSPGRWHLCTHFAEGKTKDLRVSGCVQDEEAAELGGPLSCCLSPRLGVEQEAQVTVTRAAGESPEDRGQVSRTPSGPRAPPPGPS